MNDYYEKKKKEQGIEINYALLETDKEFEAAFKQMRPNCMERNFSEYLKKQTQRTLKDTKSKQPPSKAKNESIGRRDILNLKAIESQGT